MFFVVLLASTPYPSHAPTITPDPPTPTPTTKNASSVSLSNLNNVGLNIWTVLFGFSNVLQKR